MQKNKKESSLNKTTTHQGKDHCYLLVRRLLIFFYKVEHLKTAHTPPAVSSGTVCFCILAFYRHIISLSVRTSDSIGAAEFNTGSEMAKKDVTCTH